MPFLVLGQGSFTVFLKVQDSTVLLVTSTHHKLASFAQTRKAKKDLQIAHFSTKMTSGTSTKDSLGRPCRVPLSNRISGDKKCGFFCSLSKKLQKLILKTAFNQFQNFAARHSNFGVKENFYCREKRI